METQEAAMMFDRLRLTEAQWMALLETAQRTTEALARLSPGERPREVLDHVRAHVEVLKFTCVYPGVPDEARVKAPSPIREELGRLIGEGAGR